MARGAAVEAGLMCASGKKQDLFPEKWAPPIPEDPEDSKVQRNAQVIMELTCDVVGTFDAHDTFVVKAQLLHVDRPTWDVRWVVTGGTGAIADSHGNGGGDGVVYFDGLGPPVGGLDFYSGQLH